MFKWLLVIPFVAFIDPILLYWIWPRLSNWALLGILFVYPLAADVYTRSKALDGDDVLTRGTRLAARLAAWYLGPISKIASFFLILPPIERGLINRMTRGLHAHIFKGAPMPNPKPDEPPAPIEPMRESDENLKPAKGRVIE